MRKNEEKINKKENMKLIATFNKGKLDEVGKIFQIVLIIGIMLAAILSRF